jgi:DNA invertase Pin-like site-specific DNA recombinase
MASELVKPHHLRRRAVIYVRQSTPHQVLTNQESLRLQYALHGRARALGWHEADIEVIDSDLGTSGAASDHRRGFKDLVARVTLGEVGLILSIDVTRLARNCSDWYPLLDVCGHRECLIADRDGVYDPGTPNGRLLLGLKGTISELELHTIRSRLTAGLLAKAERGELALPLPVGLVRDASGVVTKTPDREVQARIALVFDTFLQRRTAVRVVRTLHERGLALPRRDRDGQTCWRRPTIPAVTTMLKNPAYAGAFVYGRTQMGPRRRGDGRTKHKCRSLEEWKIVVKDKYPAFIDWKTFERIQTMLRDNRAEYLLNKTRGIPRDGAALLHGIAWCGECGHKMTVRYKGGSQYVCNHLRQQHGAPVCQCLRSAAIDASVAAAFLAAVAPAEIDAWRGRGRRSATPMRPCSGRRCSRSSGSATKPASPNGSSTASIPTIGSSRPNSSGAGRRRSARFVAPKRPSRGAQARSRPSPIGSIPACGPRSSPSASASPNCGPIPRSAASIARRCCAV